MWHTEQTKKSKRILGYLAFIFVLILAVWGITMKDWMYKDVVYAFNGEFTSQTRVYGAADKVISTEVATDLANDPRNSDTYQQKVNAVRNMLNGYKAPLAANAEDFVRAADLYGLDYRLLPSISIVESTGGKNLFKPYNPFGWGKWGYPNFSVAIYDVARGMSTYYAGGLKSPDAISKKYNPDTPTFWAAKVNKIMAKMPAL